MSPPWPVDDKVVAKELDPTLPESTTPSVSRAEMLEWRAAGQKVAS